jgi:2-aminoadipate transaminase
MFLWAAAPGIDADALLPIAIDHGVAFVPGRAFSVDDHPSEALRLSFATTDPAGLREAVTRLAAAIATTS